MTKTLTTRLRTQVLVIGLLLMAGDGLARTGDITRSPADLVRKYLSLDMKGVRLEAISWVTMKPYVNWKDEPVWGHTVVIREYEVVEDISRWQVLGTLEVVIPVKYRVLGSMYWETASFVPHPEVEDVGFHVKAVNGRWRIIEPMAPPHIGHKRLIQYVRQTLLDEKDETHRAQLASLWEELKKAQ
jgi:hypothetical protein